MKRFVLSLALCTSLSTQLMAATIDCQSELDPSASGQKTLLKTFTYEYWQVGTNNINELPTDLRKRGLVVGDFHFNNLGIYFDEKTAKPQLVINDFDDAGQNYLIIDLVKYLAFLKTEVKKVDLTKALEAYTKGLNGQRNKEPKEIRDLLNSKLSFYNQQLKKYTDKKVQEAAVFDIKSLNSAQMTMMEHFVRHESVSSLRKPELIFRVNDTGSSLGMERYEFVGRDVKNNVRVIEFKQLKCSGSGAPKRQDLNDSYNAVQSFYRQHFPSDYMSAQKIIFHNSNFYLIREKVNNPLKKIDIDKMPPLDQQIYANFFAHYLGLIHSQSSNTKYSSAVTSNANDILKFVKKISEEFNKEVK
jgi:hypothetical protein